MGINNSCQQFCHGFQDDSIQPQIIKWNQLNEEISFGPSQINERINAFKDSHPGFLIYKSITTPTKYCCGVLKQGDIDQEAIVYQPNKYLFQGKMQNGKPKYGKLEMFNLRKVYNGSFKNNMPDGEGTLISQNGFQIRGTWQKGEPLAGKMIVFEESSSIEFTNTHRKTITYQFEIYPMTEAIVTFEDGRIYSGELNSQRKFHGRGKFTSSSGDYTYQGEWKQNQRNGKGVAKYKSQTTYEGDFVQGKRCGYGKMIFSDGKIYQGQWKDGKQNGEGTLYQADRTIIKKGKWQNGQFLLS